ncbi:MAG: hypothetical protein ACK4SM_03620 [Aquificaceae bacterium]
MSVRHRIREYVEKLFEPIREAAEKGEEYTVYIVYTKGMEDLELIDTRVDLSDLDDTKKFLEKTAREALEKKVRGFDLLAMVLDKDGLYIFSSEETLSESLKEDIIRRIEEFKEE